MTIQELVEKLSANTSSEGELLYLSTQKPEDEEAKAPAAFQTPCEQLLKAKRIEPTLPWASMLRLESCNLWMGSSLRGSSSGLHHDYHDNFYLLLQGTKQFRLYSPDTAPSMATYGTIEKIHFNGVISYVGSETNANGTPLETNTDPARGSEYDDDDDDDDDDEEEEVVLGKGFDYHSDDDGDDEEGSVDMDGPDDFDELVEDNVDHETNHPTANGHGEQSERPNSFSRIDPTNVDPNEHSDFLACQEYVVELQPGQILYLPAGWFHCVTSFSSMPQSKKAMENKSSQVHMALNYWYHPPDRLDFFSSPYRDE